MRFVQMTCTLVLVAHWPTQFVRAQEPTASAPPASKVPQEQQGQRSASETKNHLEQLACGPPDVGFSHQTVKERQILPEQPPDKGLIYVIRTSSPMGVLVQAKLAMDGKWVGVNRTANYFHLEVDPGPHYFCMEAGGGGRGLLSLVIEKGKTYYLRQNLTLAGNDLDLLDEEKGKQYVAKYHKSVFEEKHKK